MLSNKYKGLIKCLLCGKNYKYKLERKQPAYVCSGFANYGKEFCRYFPLKESDITYLLHGHFSLLKNNSLLEEEMIGEILNIEVEEAGFRIQYRDETSSILDHSDKYGVKVKY